MDVALAAVRPGMAGRRRAPGAMPKRGNPDEGGAGQGARTLGYLGLSSNPPKAEQVWR
jgi:hypothetical protein